MDLAFASCSSGKSRVVPTAIKIAVGKQRTNQTEQPFSGHVPKRIDLDLALYIGFSGAERGGTVIMRMQGGAALSSTVQCKANDTAASRRATTKHASLKLWFNVCTLYK